MFGEQAIDGAEVTINSKTLTVTLEGDTVVAHRMHVITVQFEARIVEGADLAPYMQDGKAVVPNTASYVVNDDPSRNFESKPVTVTPPPEEPKEPSSNPDKSTKKTTSPKQANNLAKTGDPLNAVPMVILLVFGAAGLVLSVRAQRRS